ncbi:hypothetical protein DFP72DRAFT_845610 [Ephemerocybe angulata]|uniref:G domain-containing protein n=1 Tax=Ephemerocybe angulata TaxID=980116 RepID=A0A8H6MA36_9AGAR|nr:hypothetical protein DFP72DRAFT_845610 [Tulosesus angulatus]
MSKDLKGHTIAVIGKANSGKTAALDDSKSLQFIKAVCNAASDAPVPHTAHDTPTPCIVEYKAPLSNGQFLTFLDTPGFDGHQADGPGSESAKERGHPQNVGGNIRTQDEILKGWADLPYARLSEYG